MQNYRAYTVGKDGHIASAEEFTCADDPEAFEAAKRLVNGHEVELWSGTRFVIKLTSTTPD
jgi:hypothetical protein